MSWLLENWYFVAVIGFFIISALGKSGKKTEGGNNPRMPSFGGEGEHPRRQVHQEEQQTDARRSDTSPYDSHPEPAYESTWTGRMDEEEAVSGNGYSLDHQEIDRARREQELNSHPNSMDHRIEMMERDLNRIHSHLNRMTIDIPETVVESRDGDRIESKNDRSFLAEQARNGIVWAEILGTPRAKRSMNPRR